MVLGSEVLNVRGKKSPEGRIHGEVNLLLITFMFQLIMF
jgi:hypothetical protein